LHFSLTSSTAHPPPVSAHQTTLRVPSSLLKLDINETTVPICTCAHQINVSSRPTVPVMRDPRQSGALSLDDEFITGLTCKLEGWVCGVQYARLPMIRSTNQLQVNRISNRQLQVRHWRCPREQCMALQLLAQQGPRRLLKLSQTLWSQQTLHGIVLGQM
jgi:hypothetical protein